MDRGLLLSLMALEKDFITRQQVLTAFQAWLANRFLKLDEILIQRGFLTKSQLMRLSVNLESSMESSNGLWQPGIRENTAVTTVYQDLLTLSEPNSSIHQWVILLGQAMADLPSSSNEVNKNMPINLQSDSGPHGTVDLEDGKLGGNLEGKRDGGLDPFATIMQPMDEDI